MSGLSGCQVHLSGQRFVTALYAMASPFVLSRSLDLGWTWARVPAVGAPTNITASSWPSPMVGFVVDWGAGIYRTIDGGLTWTLVLAAGGYQAIAMLDESMGWACGDTATLKRTTDGGITWTACTVPSIGTAGLRDIAVAGLPSGGAVGLCVGMTDAGTGVTLTLSSAGGVETWTRRTTGVLGVSLYKCAIWRGSPLTGVCMVAGDDALSATAMYSGDTGATWAESTGIVGGDIRGFEVTSSRSVLLALWDRGGSSGIVRSVDSGATYSAVSGWSNADGAAITTLRSVYGCAAPRRAWAASAGGGMLWYSGAGGSTWHQMTPPHSLSSLAAASGLLQTGPGMDFKVVGP